MKKIFVLLLIAVTFVSCKKDNFERFTPSTGGFDAKMVTASFSGLIVGADEIGLEGVAVTIGSNTTTTDENGVFFYKDISVANTKAYFQASKAGYFHGSRTLLAHEGHTHQVRIKMLDNAPIGAIQNNSGGTVTLPEGGQLTFEAGDVAYPNGNAYTGQVNVAAKRLDPTTSNGPFEMPGDLRGITAANEEASLISYGMMAVELTDQSGNLLQVAPDQTVEMTFEIPSSLVSSAKETIPLWYFDEDLGEWKEEGTATLSGTTFKGEVSHFTYWNCDYYGDRVYFEALFVDAEGNPMPNVWIHIGLTEASAGGHGFTDDNGWAGGQIPGNETVGLYYRVDGSGCSQSSIFLMEFTTTNVDVNLGTITLDPQNQVDYTVTGSLVDCDNNPISNGYVRSKSTVWSFSMSETVASDGTFSLSGTTCSGAPVIKLTGYDLVNLVQSDELVVDLAVTQDVGEIIACDIALDQYIILNMLNNLGNDTTFTIVPPINFYVQKDSVTDSFQSWHLYATSQNYFTLKSTTEGVGVYAGNGAYESNFAFADFSCSLNITSYPTSPGEYIIGTIEPNGSTPEVTGSFRIKK